MKDLAIPAAILLAVTFAIGLGIGLISDLATDDEPPPAQIIHVNEIHVKTRYVDIPVISTVTRYDGEYQTYEVTAYTAGEESTGKTPAHPLYGVTASGAYVEEGRTIACPPSLAFGTKIYIPEMENVYTCEDRGSAITEGHLDIYVADLDEALTFGRRDMDVLILP